ncbi:MAG TPA: hypothetical protein VN026_10725 [Bacteroidia bacterium]|nr:hypothetical protein [Bacteroidia bacterium]
MTIPPFGIFVDWHWKGCKHILVHHKEHWRQYLRLGFFLFYIRYFLQLLIFGHDEMPMEVDARYKEALYRRTHWIHDHHRPIRRKIIKRKRK